MSVDGTWKLTLQTPMGARPSTLTLNTGGGGLQGTMEGDQGTTAIENGAVSGNAVSWSINAPALAMTIAFSGTVEGDTISGSAELGAFGSAPFSGTRA